MMHISFSFASRSNTTFLIYVSNLWLHLKLEGEKPLISFPHVSEMGKRPNVRGGNGYVLDQKKMFFVPLGTLIYIFFLLIQEKEKKKSCTLLFDKCRTKNSTCVNKSKRSQHELQLFLLNMVIPFPIVMILSDDLS